MPRPDKYPPDQELPFTAHLLELRSRLLRIVGTIMAVFLVLMPFANQIYAVLALPLLQQLPQGATMIATEVTSPFLAPFKFALVFSVFIAMPAIIYQIWGFVAPGLHRSEQRLAFPLIVSAAVLFYCGVLFAYFVVFPLMFGFFVAVAPEGVSVMTDIGKYLDFVMTVFFAFGVAFEVPVATILLVKAGVATPDGLVAKRPYVIVGAFIIGMLLTPPDVISQTLLAVPMWLLFEVGVYVARRISVPAADDQSSPDDKATPEQPPPPGA
ncbi:MAG: sec-independent protein translocase protein TatC [Gammaproteobacteria bacterium]|nr:MAG: sec-independent protein translocase protein TatC [Gammaproteobacteria bacterium]TND06265.1 MAG: sec-independent protein translocase protein TatC [Gammaproteobacteria bacterium]